MARRPKTAPPYVVEPRGEWSVARSIREGPCPVCQGRGVIHDEQERGYRVAMPCTCQAEERRLVLFNRAHVPAHYADKTLDNFQTAWGESEGMAEAHRAAVQLVKQYPLGERRGLVLTGPVGVGKTHLAAAVVRRLTLELGVPSRFYDFLQLLHDLKATFERREGTAALLESLGQVDVLVIDDLGKGRGSDWELEVLDELVGRRYNAAATTIATTNYRDRPPTDAQAREGFFTESLRQRVGDRIYSRLRGMGLVLEMDGEDYRLSAAAKRGSK